jgi:GntR family transcriptional repressor for pyruvate dehydrogenase complex
MMMVVNSQDGIDGSGGSLVQRAIQAVSDHIEDQGLHVGDTLPGEAHFAQLLGVSRAVMREAFGALAALRRIDVGNGRKPRVAAIDGTVIARSLQHAVTTEQISVPEVWDVRRTIELRTATLAATQRTAAEASAILTLAEAMAEDLDDFDRMTRHDIAFHDEIARASHNLLFVQIVASFGPLMEVAVPTAWRTRRTDAERRTMIDRHLELARAIEAGDPEAAAHAMGAHFDSSIGNILNAKWSVHGDDR